MPGAGTTSQHLVTNLEQLGTAALSARLHALAAKERELHADFLAYLDALDRRRGYAELGYSSLWEYCLRALHLREAAAGRRIAAMRVLRTFPRLEPALRDGRLGLSTLAQLAPMLTRENVDELAARAAFKSTREVEEIVASLRPRAVPADGLRLARGKANAAPTAALPSSSSAPAPPAAQRCTNDAPPSANDPRLPTNDTPHPTNEPRLLMTDPPRRAQVAARAELNAVASHTWSLRVTLDAEAKRDLETLADLLSHKVSRRDLAAVLKEALRCAVEKHGRRRGAVAPSRSPRPPPRDLDRTANRTADRTGNPTAKSHANPSANSTASKVANPAANRTANSAKLSAKRIATTATESARPSRYIPAAVRRAVWARDGGCCTYVAPDGTRCGSRERLELDHVQPFALGGEATVDDLRLRCRTHNLWHAEQWFGRSHMAKFRRRDVRRSRELGVAATADAIPAKGLAPALARGPAP